MKSQTKTNMFSQESTSEIRRQKKRKSQTILLIATIVVLFIFGLVIVSKVLVSPLRRGISKTVKMSKLHWAAWEGKTEKVKKYLSQGEDVNSRDINNNTPLHFAAMGGHLDIIEILINNKADINSKGAQGSTPLHCAVARGHPEAVKLLISKGASLAVRDYRNRTPLELAFDIQTREPPAIFKGKIEKLQKQVKLCEQVILDYLEQQR